MNFEFCIKTESCQVDDSKTTATELLKEALASKCSYEVTFAGPMSSDNRIIFEHNHVLRNQNPTRILLVVLWAMMQTFWAKTSR